MSVITTKLPDGSAGDNSRSKRNASDYRTERYQARRVLWLITKRKAQRACGHWSIKKDSKVGIRATAREDGAVTAGFSGLATCGSVWACPVCSAKILGHRQGELQTALETHAASGGRVAMVTLTMRHEKGQALADLWNGVSDAWHKVTSGRAWEAIQDTYGAEVERVVTRGRRAGQTVTESRIDWVRVVEVTHGVNGWHVHVHAVLFLPAKIREADCQTIAWSMYGRWSDSLVRSGFAAPILERGLDVRLWEDGENGLADYFTKNVYYGNIAAEATRSDFKKGKNGNRSPFQILADLLEFSDTGDITDPATFTDLNLWHEWERYSLRRRQQTWSVGARARLVPDQPELTDEEIAAQDEGTEDLCTLDQANWSKIVANGWECEVLEVVEADQSGEALQDWLVRHQVYAHWCITRPE